MTRSDGRGSAELRPTRLTPGFLLHAEGSVLIEVGRTKVVCAATIVGVVGGLPMLDLAYDEDSRADVDMNIIKTGDGRFIEIQGTAEGPPFERQALDDLLALADEGIRELVALQRGIVGDIRA